MKPRTRRTRTITLVHHQKSASNGGSEQGSRARQPDRQPTRPTISRPPWFNRSLPRSRSRRTHLCPAAQRARGSPRYMQATTRESGLLHDTADSGSACLTRTGGGTLAPTQERPVRPRPSPVLRSHSPSPHLIVIARRPRRTQLQDESPPSRGRAMASGGITNGGGLRRARSALGHGHLLHHPGGGRATVEEERRRGGPSHQSRSLADGSRGRLALTHICSPRRTCPARVARPRPRARERDRL